MAKEYRPDIDGLRAIAILAVVAFHFGVPGLGGGFAGVDVFFVVSGYLVGRQILAERLAGKFSWAGFWARRARRLLPALLVMLLGTLLLAAWMMTPNDFGQLGRVVRYQAMFLVNVLFARQGDYFGSAAAAMPLLHTWSLSVVGQFYLLIPALLALALRAGRYWRWWVFGGALASFAVCEGWWLQGAEPSAFYLLPARAWELLAGVLLAGQPAPRRRAAATAASLAGAALVLLPVLVYSAASPWPGIATLPLVAGTTLLLWAGAYPITPLKVVLSWPPLVALGRLSYSWYLWHWPLLVLAKYAWPAVLPAWALASVAVTGLGLGYASWRWVERPIHQRRWLGTQPSLVFASIAGVVLVGALGQAIRDADGWPWRLPAQALRYASERHWQAGQNDCMANDHTPAEAAVCRLGPKDEGAPTTLVWGDSHAAALVPALRTSTQRFDVPVSLATHSGCLPVLGLDAIAGCRVFTQRVLEAIARQNVSDVVLAARWSRYLYDDHEGSLGHLLRTPSGQYERSDAEQRLAEALGREVAGFRAQGRRVWLVSEVPQQASVVPYQLARLAMLGRPVQGLGVPLASHQARMAFIAGLFAKLAEDPGVHVLDPAGVLCADGRTCQAEAGGHALYKDDNHLSDASGEYLAPLLVPVFSAAVSQVLQGPATPP